MLRARLKMAAKGEFIFAIGVDGKMKVFTSASACHEQTGLTLATREDSRSLGRRGSSECCKNTRCDAARMYSAVVSYIRSRIGKRKKAEAEKGTTARRHWY